LPRNYGYVIRHEAKAPNISINFTYLFIPDHLYSCQGNFSIKSPFFGKINNKWAFLANYQVCYKKMNEKGLETQNTIQKADIKKPLLCTEGENSEYEQA